MREAHAHAARERGVERREQQLPLQQRRERPLLARRRRAGRLAAARQVQRASHLVAVLEAAGCSVGDVVKTSVFLTDLGDFAAMNAVYAGVFGTDAPPARACVQVAALPKGCDVEIDCIAKLP